MAFKDLHRTCVAYECDLTKSNESYAKCLDAKKALEKVRTKGLITRRQTPPAHSS